MTHPLFRIVMICGVCLLCGFSAQAQHSSGTQRGTIEESWIPAKAPMRKVELPAKPTTVWQQQRRPAPAHLHGWPDHSTRPVPSDLYTANAALIDSLETSHCINVTYASTLRARNNEARSSISPAPSREFSYGTIPPKTHSAPPVVNALSALHQELTDLLELCYGADVDRP